MNGNVLSPISNRNRYLNFSPSQTSEMPPAGFKPAQNLSFESIESIKKKANCNYISIK